MQHVLLIASACSLLVGVYGIRCVAALEHLSYPWRDICVGVLVATRMRGTFVVVHGEMNVVAAGVCLPRALCASIV